MPRINVKLQNAHHPRHCEPGKLDNGVDSIELGEAIRRKGAIQPGNCFTPSR